MSGQSVRELSAPGRHRTKAVSCTFNISDNGVWPPGPPGGTLGPGDQQHQVLCLCCRDFTVGHLPSGSGGAAVST